MNPLDKLADWIQENPDVREALRDQAVEFSNNAAEVCDPARSALLGRASYIRIWLLGKRR